jgi:hypothetical protein
MSLNIKPKRLRVLSNYAFYDEDGAFRSWAEREIVTDPGDIALLVARRAPFEIIEESEEG